MNIQVEGEEPKKYVPSVIAKHDAAPPPVRVVVLLPTHETMEAGFAFDLQKMMLRMGASVVADGIMDVRTFMLMGTLITFARNDILKDAMQRTDATHYLFMDTDHRFPWQSLLRLLSANKDIVGVNYSVRKGTPRSTAFLDLEESDEKLRFLQPAPEGADKENQYVKVDAVGMGMTLIRAHVFDAIEFPWFETVYDKVNRKWVGEDVDFCNKARAAGFDIWVDTLLSEEIAHIGRFDYRLDHVRALNEAHSDIAEENAPLIVAP